MHTLVFNQKQRVEGKDHDSKSLSLRKASGAHPGFCSMNQLGVFVLPPGWDASPLQGYPPALNSPVPVYTPGWREAL